MKPLPIKIKHVIPEHCIHVGPSDAIKHQRESNYLDTYWCLFKLFRLLVLLDMSRGKCITRMSSPPLFFLP